MKRLHLLLPFLCILTFTAVKDGSTKIWVEDFEDGHLDAWAVDKTNDRTTWKAKDGHMDVWIEPDNRGGRQSYVLEFIGFAFRAEKLNVKVTILEVEEANVGILIGQHDLDDGIGLHRRTYKVVQKGGIWGPIEFPDQNPQINYDIEKVIEVDFDKGHFELLSEGEHILEFDEPNLPHIDCLGIVVFASKPPLAHFVLDDFIISGPSIPSKGSLDVQPHGKVAVLWGELKR